MKLGNLLPILCDPEHERAARAAHGDLEITALVNNSQRARPGCLFVALRGAQSDGHAYIPNALLAGAVAVVSERPVALNADVPLFVVPDARKKLSALAALFYGDPTASLHVTGITGTNGKTTTSYRTRSILKAAGHPTGLLGTIAYQVGDRCIPASNTTPDSLLIQDLFAQMVEAGETHAVIEVSSHALDLARVYDVRFATAVFTSLSDHEHLDYHGTFERYRDTKARLFEMLTPGGCAVVNADDPNGGFMAEHTPRDCEVLWFALKNKADVTARIAEMSMEGTTYQLTTPDGEAYVHSVLVGEFNVLNDLAAAAAAAAAGASLDAIVAGLERREPVPGRLEKVPARTFYPLVDYAHNEGALDCVLKTVRALAGKRLLVVFGAGGDRDRTKRPKMGAVAEKYADLIFLTADNSRSEDPRNIISEIELGMTDPARRLVIPDREMAIRAAVEAARPGDVLLVAGKGHETYQIFKDTKTPFDDREVLRAAIAECEELEPARAVRAET